MNFQYVWNDYQGLAPPSGTNDASAFTFKPVIPLKFLDHANILRLTFPYQAGGREDEGFQPISLFDLIIF